MRLRTALLAAACLAAAAPLTAVATAGTANRTGPVAEGVGENVRPIAHVPYAGGTDLEFATIRGRDYAVAPSMSGGDGGLRMIDITTPSRPRVVGFLPCGVAQNDVQVRGTLVLMGVDYNARDAACFQQLGRDPATGVMVIDIANPARPRAIGFAPVRRGAHNVSWHPGGRYAYVSDSELVPSTSEPRGSEAGRIQIVDLGDPRRPAVIGQLGLPPGLSNHDVTFNRSGTRGYAAAITQTLILDTSYPSAPRIVTTIVDPAVNISHGADPTPDGRYLLVTDEQAGAQANGVCNVGGVHVYDLRNELVPVKVGYYPFNPANSLLATRNSGNIVCTAHVLDYAPDGSFFSNAGYAAGVRVVDALNLVGSPVELGSFTPVDANTWSAKTYRNKRYLFANDLRRGLDVYEYDPRIGKVDTRSAATKAGRISFATPEDAELGPRSYCLDLAGRRPVRQPAKAA